jgi:hypothetical protein
MLAMVGITGMEGGCLWSNRRQRWRDFRNGWSGPEVRKITDGLDSSSGTPYRRHRQKGFAIGSAALTALALFSAFAQAVSAETSGICRWRASVADCSNNL